MSDSAIFIADTLRVQLHGQSIGYSEADLLISYPSLSATDIANAWVYAEGFPDEIETDIQENDFSSSQYKLMWN